MKGFPFVTAIIAVLIGAKFSDDILKVVKDIPVIGDFLAKGSTSA